MLPMGSVGILTIIVAAYRSTWAHDYGPLRMQGENLHAVSEYRGVPVWRDIRSAPVYPPTFQCEPLRQGDDRRHQLGWINRFCEMGLEAGFQRFHPILGST